MLREDDGRFRLELPLFGETKLYAALKHHLLHTQTKLVHLDRYFSGCTFCYTNYTLSIYIYANVHPWSICYCFGPTKPSPSASANMPKFFCTCTKTYVTCPSPMSSVHATSRSKHGRVAKHARTAPAPPRTILFESGLSGGIMQLPTASHTVLLGGGDSGGMTSLRLLWQKAQQHVLSILRRMSHLPVKKDVHIIYI